eukprot:3766489-Rhodomonas_salina.1
MAGGQRHIAGAGGEGGVETTGDNRHCLGWNFLLSLREHLGMNIVGGMSALSIPPMFRFTHPRWDMEE